jgi:hypothetical protein
MSTVFARLNCFLLFITNNIFKKNSNKKFKKRFEDNLTRFVLMILKPETPFKLLIWNINIFYLLKLIKSIWYIDTIKLVCCKCIQSVCLQFIRFIVNSSSLWQWAFFYFFQNFTILIYNRWKHYTVYVGRSLNLLNFVHKQAHSDRIFSIWPL